jgi:hypothetical protein
MTSAPHEPAFQRAYYRGFVWVMLACFSPFKLLTYAVPVGFVVWLAWREPRALVKNRVATVVLCVFTLGAFYALVEEEFLVTNYVFSAVTYSAFLPLLLIDGRLLASAALRDRLVAAAMTMILLQSVLGILQAIYGASITGSFGYGNGDFVQGTIHPYFGSKGGFDNPIFAVNITLMLLACLTVPDAFSGTRRLHLALGTVALVLASVIHVLIYLAASLVLSFVLIRARRNENSKSQTKRVYRNISVMVLLAGVAVYTTLAGDVAQIGNIGGSAVDLEAEEVPRAIMLYRVINELPETAPIQPFVGLGPGQFSSRASLIASGLYLGGPDAKRALPFVGAQSTRLAADYAGALLITFADVLDSLGSTHQPFFSFLSVYTETGLLGLGLVLFVVGRIIWRVRQAARTNSELRTQAMLFCTGTIFLMLLGFQENYWEVPHAILVGLLLLKVLHANIVYRPVEVVR